MIKKETVCSVAMAMVIVFSTSAFAALLHNIKGGHIEHGERATLNHEVRYYNNHAIKSNSLPHREKIYVNYINKKKHNDKMFTVSKTIRDGHYSGCRHDCRINHSCSRGSSSSNGEAIAAGILGGVLLGVLITSSSNS